MALSHTRYLFRSITIYIIENTGFFIKERAYNIVELSQGR
jgi:hypothetical protein